MVMVGPLFCPRRFVRLPKLYVPVVLLYSGLCRSTTLLFLLGGSNCRVEGPSYLFDTITIFRKSGFEEPNSSWRLSFLQRALAVCTNVERLACMLEGSRIHVEVSVGRFSVDLMAQEVIQSPVYVDVEKG